MGLLSKIGSALKSAISSAKSSIQQARLNRLERRAERAERRAEKARQKLEEARNTRERQEAQEEVNEEVNDVNEDRREVIEEEEYTIDDMEELEEGGALDIVPPSPLINRFVHDFYNDTGGRISYNRSDKTQDFSEFNKWLLDKGILVRGGQQGKIYVDWDLFEKGPSKINFYANDISNTNTGGFKTTDEFLNADITEDVDQTGYME